ncbi:hypothetical protein Vafri_16058 [Volvox africanus]|nr:hypothetical protein Vafri_16058 [Volvox africanus]
MGLSSTLGVQVGYCDGSNDGDSDGDGDGGKGYISDGGGGGGDSGQSTLVVLEEVNITRASKICARTSIEAATADIVDSLARMSLRASTQPTERTTLGSGFTSDNTATAIATASDAAVIGFPFQQPTWQQQQQQQQQQAYATNFDDMAPGVSAPLPRKMDAELHPSPYASSAGVQQLSTNSARLPAPLVRSALKGSGRLLPVMPEHLAEAEVEARTAAMALPGRRSPAWVIRRINEAKQEKLVSEVSAWLRAALEQRGSRRGLEDTTWTPASTETKGSAGPGGTAGRY